MPATASREDSLPLARRLRRVEPCADKVKMSHPISDSTADTNESLDDVGGSSDTRNPGLHARSVGAAGWPIPRARTPERGGTSDREARDGLPIAGGPRIPIDERRTVASARTTARAVTNGLDGCLPLRRGNFGLGSPLWSQSRWPGYPSRSWALSPTSAPSPPCDWPSSPWSTPSCSGTWSNPLAPQRTSTSRRCLGPI